MSTNGKKGSLIPAVKLALSLPEQIASHLRREILSGQLEPGTSLLETPLAQRFGISRGPIRDAFITLAKEGLLVAKPNIGVKVAPAPSEFKRSVIVSLRRDIECAALGHWVGQPAPGPLKQLDENLRDFERACRAGELVVVVELDMNFHRLLVEAAEEGGLVDLWLPVISRMYLRYSRHRHLIESYREHLAIVKAIRAGDGPLALERLGNHIQ